MKGKILFTVFLAALAVLFFDSCRKDPASISTTQSGAVSDRVYCDNPTQTLNSEGSGGNAVCSGDYEVAGERINIDQSLPYPQTGTLGPITWTIAADGQTLSWEGNVCGISVIVKGGNASYTYTYEDGCTAGGGLISPTNNGGNTPAISNITFCYNECTVPVCTTETGFGGANAGAGSAWWYYYSTAVGGQQPIYAGQQLMAGGWVEYANGTMTIHLGPNWSLQNVAQPVKIQGYSTLPGKRPSAGLFTTYKGNALVIPNIPSSPYFVIHLDVEYCE